MHTRIGRRAAIGALAAAVGTAGGVMAQPQLDTTGGGTGDAEMDHARTGGGRQGAGGGTPSMRVTGGGTGDAEMVHPPAAGLGGGFPQGGRIIGNAGGDGGFEIQHGHTPAQSSFPRRRSN